MPDGFTRSPTTRQLILFAIRAEPAGAWPIARIFDVAAMHRWIDADDQEQLKRITDMTALMAREGVLIRTGRGVYKLRDDLIGALSRALPDHGLPRGRAHGDAGPRASAAAPEVGRASRNIFRHPSLSIQGVSRSATRAGEIRTSRPRRRYRPRKRRHQAAGER